MSKYSEMSAEELEKLIAKEDKDAHYEAGLRFKHSKNLAEAKKYFIFASQLGNGNAGAELGAMYENEGNLSKAIEQYTLATDRGCDSVSCRLATLLFPHNEEAAVEVLIKSAINGNDYSIRMLEDHYTKMGDKEEAKYWADALRKQYE